jgi:hypothetical protein
LIEHSRDFFNPLDDNTGQEVTDVSIKHITNQEWKHYDFRRSKSEVKLNKFRSRVLLEKLTVAKLLKKFTVLYRTRRFTFSCSQQSATGPYPESLHILFNI